MQKRVQPAIKTNGNERLVANKKRQREIKSEHSVMCVIYCAFQLNVSFTSSQACETEIEIAVGQPPALFLSVTM